MPADCYRRAELWASVVIGEMWLTIRADIDRFANAMRDVERVFLDTNKAMRQLQKNAKLHRRDMIRANRRPPLINKGRKP